MISESFPKSHKLSKILNRNTTKISYSCLPNIGSKILADASNKYKGPTVDLNPPCIGHRNNLCPVVGGKCNLKNNVIEADKTTNLYQISVGKYSKLIHDNVTSEYKIADANVSSEVLESEKKVASQVDLGDRMEIPSKVNARITIKDTKANFRTDTKCRLINPAKLDSGRISKIILDDIQKSKPIT